MSAITKTNQNSDDDIGNSHTGNAHDKEKLFNKAHCAVHKYIMYTRDKSNVCHVTFTDSNAFETMPLDSPRLPREIRRILRKELKMRPPKPLV